LRRLLWGTLAFIVALSGLSWAQSAQQTNARAGSGKGPLVGAWRLAWLDEPGPDGNMRHITDAKGSLIYTSDGHVSVQVMFAHAETASSSSPVQYTQGGYEASFGRYQVDEGAQTVTHRYEAANVRTLVGQDFPRRYQFTDGRLIIRSTRSDERWSVGWERD
jgi:hypothetical protein